MAVADKVVVRLPAEQREALGRVGACADKPLKRSALVGGQPDFDLARWGGHDGPPAGAAGES